MTEECDFCGTEKPDAKMRFTAHHPVWPCDGSPAFLSWEKESVCDCCFRWFLKCLPSDEQRQLTLEKNGEVSS